MMVDGDGARGDAGDHYERADRGPDRAHHERLVAKTSFAHWRALMEIPQRVAADILGVSVRTIERYENGGIVPHRSVRRTMLME